MAVLASLPQVVSALDAQAPPLRPVPVKAKVCLVGESAVGKTSLIRRFVYEQFEGAYVSTLGVKVSTKRVTLSLPGADAPVALDMTIWDIMGARGFREVLQDAYFYGARGILAVCDVTRKETLKELASWFDAVLHVTGPVPVRILANKVDLEDARVLTDADLRPVAEAYNAEYLFTSAKTGLNVEAGFDALGADIARRVLAKR